MIDTVRGDDMTPQQRAASALLANLHNSNAVVAVDVHKSAEAILTALEAAVAAEREACAKIARATFIAERDSEFDIGAEVAREVIAAAIRSRGEKT